MSTNDKSADKESGKPAINETMLDDEFSLEAQKAPLSVTLPKKESPRKSSPGNNNKGQAPEVLSYRYDDKRTNNPHVGMVDTYSDGVEGKTVWQYDPHIDPALNFDSGRSTVENLIDNALASGDKDRMQTALEQLKRMQSPYLAWAGKAERTRFAVDTVSLHVHERIDPATILAAVQKKLKDGKGKSSAAIQPDLFHAPFENLPLREAIDFYKHERDWANRLIAGDSLLVMNSLLQKEGMAGQVQMIYIDPPYGIKYGSNFQPFVNKRDVKDRSDADLTQEPEMIKAFRDTWELGIHSYLTYLRDRLLLAKELLHESGSVFVQISDENVHLMRNLLDEVFSVENFCSEIVFRKKTMPMGSDYFESVCDYILWYAKDKSKVKTQNLRKNMDVQGDSIWSWVELPDYSRQRMTRGEIDNHRLLPTGSKVYRLVSLLPAQYRPNQDFVFEHNSISYNPPSNSCWKTNREGMQLLAKANRLQSQGKGLQQIMFADDYPVSSLTALWGDTGGASDKTYVVQTSITPLERCLLASTDPGDLILDPTCGSGTTAFVAEKWGRRWITCDTSRVAVTLAKQRLMTASYDYYALKYPHEGLKSGFIYKTVPHVTLKSIANNPDIDEIYARMHPAVETALVALNAVLPGSPSFPRRRESSDSAKVVDARLREHDDQGKGGRDDQANVGWVSDASASRNPPYNNVLMEWEVPFDFPVDWPEAAKKPFDAFHAARQAMQKKMDESIAAHAGQEILYDQPAVSKNKLRITGPFTVEAVPFATVLGLDEAEQPKEADVAVARSGATWRQSQWRDELLKAGIRRQRRAEDATDGSGAIAGREIYS